MEQYLLHYSVLSTAKIQNNDELWIMDCELFCTFADDMYNLNV